MKRVVKILLFCLLATNTQAQITLGYSIGSIGGGAMKTMAATNSLLINGQNCFNVSNSISTLKIANKGDFNQNCQINYTVTPFKINLNPNPVDRVTVVQLMDKILNDNQFRLTLFTNSGQALYAIDIVQDQLLAGYRMDLSNLTAGYYYLQVASQKVVKSIKILKN